MERVVVTGIGILSSIGIGHEEFWKNAVMGKNGVGKVKSFDTSEYQSDIGGEIKDFDVSTQDIKTQKIGKCSKYGIITAKMAFEDARADELNDFCKETRVFMGSTMGEGEELIKSMSDNNSESLKNIAVSNIATGICCEFNINNRAVVVPNACAAGNFAIISAYEDIKRGRCKYAFAGGCDIFSQTAYVGFSKLRSMAKDKCRPFDKDREGMVIGEGAGVLFLESYSSAVQRNAIIYAEIIGWGASCDAFHMVTPRNDAKGIKKCMSDAVKSANINFSDIDYISAHGTGTAANDAAECLAIDEIFKGKVAVNSIKSMIGHSMGAASAIEAAVCCLVIHNKVIPPTINFNEYDDNCKIDCVPNKSRQCNVKIAANNAYAFGGNNTCVLFSEVTR